MISPLTDIVCLRNSYPFIDPDKFIFKRLTSSGIVYPKPCWVYWYGLGYEVLWEWVVARLVMSPVGGWYEINKAADNSISTYAYASVLQGQSSNVLRFYATLNQMVSRIRVYTYNPDGRLSKMVLTRWYGGGSELLNEDTPPVLGWKTITVSPPKTFDYLHVSFSVHPGAGTVEVRVYEVEFSLRIKSLLWLINGFHKNDDVIMDLGTEIKNVSDCVLKQPVFFSKGLYVAMSPDTTRAEVLYVPVY